MIVKIIQFVVVIAGLCLMSFQVMAYALPYTLIRSQDVMPCIIILTINGIYLGFSATAVYLYVFRKEMRHEVNINNTFNQ